MEEKKNVVYVLHGFWENEFTNGCAVVDVSIDLETVMKKLDVIVEKLTKEELAKKEQDRKSKEVKEILKGSAARRKDFISGIISGKIPALKDENAAREKIWEALVLIGYGLYGSIARGFFLEDDEWKYSEEERKQATETFQGLSITHQMLVFLHGSMNTVGETYDYSGRYAKEKADKLLKGYEALKLFGWFFEMDEEKRVLDGTSELFAPAEEK